MDVFAIRKNEQYSMKNISLWVFFFSNAQGQIIPQSDVKFGRKLKPIRDVIIVLVTTKNEEGPKNKLPKHFHHYNYGSYMYLLGTWKIRSA